MPSSLHPQAKFDPIPPDLDLSTLVEKTSNFDYVIRISTDQIRDLGLHEFEKLVILHVIIGGKPLVVEGWNRSLPRWLFSSTWLEENMGKKHENVRDIGNSTDMPMTIGHYLNAMEKLTRQWTPSNFRDLKRQRLYLKDIDCPEAWHQHLQNIVPQTLFYLNECMGEKGGPGAIHERNVYDQLVLGKGVGTAGDLMSNLPPEMRAENMMCYIGHEGTYTPAHREMCASLGQNIMVETSSAESGEKPGSSIWFMTESKDREVVSEYFLSMLGHDIEVESHFAQINAWKKAPFPVYIVEQKLGDFILIPPLAPHQVWNRGTRTMKVAWNRTTVDTLELALHEALPRARMVCRDEQYKCKAIVYYSLMRYYDQLKRVEQAEDAPWDGHVKESIRNDVRVKQLKRDFRRLFALFTEILISEMFSPDLPKEKNIEFLPFDSHVTCSYCRCNIFNRFLTCKTCIDVLEDSGEEDTYDVCMECYAMGRSCGCLSNLTWVEQWQWPELTQNYENWRTMMIGNNGYIDIESSPQTLEIARLQYNKKTVAQICQEQLRRRPWKDISKPVAEDPSPRFEASPEIDDEGYAKRKKPSKRKGRRRESQKDLKYRCHICKTDDWKWRLAFCSTCTTAYCYGTLWRAFDLKPQMVMEDADWQCPKCLKICSCGKCRKDPSQQAYRPKGTLLGHDTRRVADPRSVESLVDFGRANLFWLRDDGDNDPQTSLRMQKLMAKAQNEKARDETLDEEAVDESRMQMVDSVGSKNSGHEIAIDPQLQDLQAETIIQVHDTQSIQILNLSESSSMPRHISAEDQNCGSNVEQLDGNERANIILKDHVHLPYRSPYPQGVNPTTRASIIIPDLPYLGSSAPMRDRMMGMGYYQQANDPDKILFDHPDISTPTDQESSVTYPRLLVNEPDFTGSFSKKRKGESASKSNTGEVNAAHLEFYQAEKKQKLADAKKNETYFITRNLLGGGRSLIVKLPMQMSKEFLQTLEELNPAQMRPKHKPRSAHRKQADQDFYSGNDDDTIIVRSDVQDKVVHGSMGDDDAQEDSITLATRAIRKLRMPPALSTLADGAELPKVLKKSGRSKNSDNNAPDDTFTASLATKLSDLGHPTSLTPKSRFGQPKALDSQTWTTVNRQSRSHKSHDDKHKIASPSDRGSHGSHSQLPQTPSAIREPLQLSSPSLSIISNSHKSSSKKSPRITAVSKAPPNDLLEKISNDPLEKNTRASQEGASKSLQGNVGKGMTRRVSRDLMKETPRTFLEKAPINLPDNVFSNPLEEAIPPPLEKTHITLAKQASKTSSKNALKARRNRESWQASRRDATSTPPSSASIGGEEDIVLVYDDYRPVSASACAKTKPPASRPSLYISEDYLSAKEQALRMVEAALEKESGDRQQPGNRREFSVPAGQPVKAGGISSHTKSPRTIVKCLPKAPPGKLLSMAERQALRGKSFKIVGTRSSPKYGPTNTLTAISTTEPLIPKKPSSKELIVAVSQDGSSPSEDSSAEASTSDNNSDSIPAIHLATEKPRLEKLAGYDDRSKVNGKHISRRLDNIYRGKSLARNAK